MMKKLLRIVEHFLRMALYSAAHLFKHFTTKLVIRLLVKVESGDIISKL